ncbi:Serine/threonine-protein phosphatase 2A 65 kDa regulatory subunit A alpha isoform [Vitis vinifera]|uniref:Serine/threonine-protein phosphatase 2A 65 kDa regulatory subunit A alpha isoform n=1 Tax=Vitis vinifera TaxID=29760 RepID=A0A438BPC9_VITVI|nr:Serine/threonine-protein phosphatase 2A 65 kDa regulatory subunit A alpha isoform [Vitis vinifera]
MLHRMVVLEQDMRQEASLCPVQHNMVVLVWEASKSDQMVEEVPVAHIGEVNKKASIGEESDHNPLEMPSSTSYSADQRSKVCKRVPTSSSLDHEKIKVTASPTNESFSASHQSNISTAATVEAAHSKADIMSIFEDLTQDDRDSVRSDLVPTYVRLLHDNEAEVRIAAAGKVTKFCWILNPKLAIPPPPGNDIQAFIDLLNDELAARSPTTDHVEGCDLCLDDFDAQLQLLNAGIN